MIAPSARHGFTLIELSIVLVIIGLIVGGVLVGRDLIHAANIRATVKQVEQYNAAVNTFRTKYNCLPGDCPNASDFGMDPIGNGDGDGIIGCTYNTPLCGSTKEAANFWYHLNAAGLIPGNATGLYAGQFVAMAGVGIPGLSTPHTIISARSTIFGPNTGGWIVGSGVYFTAGFGGGSFPAHSLILADAFGAVYNGGNHGVYAPADIQAIDAKLDDGLPLTGSARAYFWYDSIDMKFGDLAGVSGMPGPGGSGAAVCVRNDTSPFQYNSPYTGGICGIVIKASF